MCSHLRGAPLDRFLLCELFEGVARLLFLTFSRPVRPVRRRFDMVLTAAEASASTRPTKTTPDRSQRPLRLLVDRYEKRPGPAWSTRVFYAWPRSKKRRRACAAYRASTRSLLIRASCSRREIKLQTARAAQIFITIFKAIWPRPARGADQTRATRHAPVRYQCDKKPGSLREGANKAAQK